MKERNNRILILGAGLAGLSAAYHSGFPVYEAQQLPGGTCRTQKLNDYTFDLGIHVLHSNNCYVLNLLKNVLKLNFIEHNRVGRIFSFNRFTRYPFQANTFGLPIPIVKECLVSYIEAFCKRNNNQNLKFENYKDWIISSFGEGVAKHFMIPYSEKFWTIPVYELTTEWLGKNIPMPTLDEVIEGALTKKTKEIGLNHTFRYPIKNGISALPEAFMKCGIKVFFNKLVVKIDLKNKEILFSDGTLESYHKLISTIPLPDLVRFVEAPISIMEIANQLKHNSIMCVNLGIDKDRLSDKHWIHYPEKKYSFFRISFPSNFSSQSAPKGKSSISAEVAYSYNKMIDKTNIVDTVIKDLIATKVIDKNHKIELITVKDIKYAYVIYDHNRLQCLNKIKQYLKENSIIVCGRYGNWEYQWMDDAILDGKRAADETV